MATETAFPCHVSEICIDVLQEPNEPGNNALRWDSDFRDPVVINLYMIFNGCIIKMTAKGTKEARGKLASHNEIPYDH